LPFGSRFYLHRVDAMRAEQMAAELQHIEKEN
jgi:DNA-directed RNA polymerase subunit K/omega